MDKNHIFPFEETEIYRTALEFTSKCREICNQLPKGYASDADQLRRASLSICNNYAEGFGRWGVRDKKHFYTISKGSAYECVPIITLLFHEKKISAQNYGFLRKLIGEITKMLTALIQDMEKRK